MKNFSQSNVSKNDERAIPRLEMMQDVRKTDNIGANDAGSIGRPVV